MKTKILKQRKRGKRTILPAEIDEKALEIIRTCVKQERLSIFIPS